ncbi:MAG TPA: potassium-transporting ATPase subunit C [Actinomycetota bacterium]|nr:potassium-transporting ATPase subunit C [Actinomycetota bacterium]
MRKDIVGSLVAIVLLTVGFGLVYPLVMTGVAQVTFRDRANGSQVERDGKVVGSSLIGQDFRKPVLDANGQPQMDADGNPVLEADPSWFQSRPSQSGYSANVTFFNNLGPNQKDLADLVKANLDAYLTLERRYTPTLTADGVPVDAVTSSASGVDPHISVANARIQANRIAAVRGAPLVRVLALVARHTDGRALGLLGEPGVNVLRLNLALDKEFPLR